jgi:hypothetical protein
MAREAGLLALSIYAAWLAYYVDGEYERWVALTISG